METVILLDSARVESTDTGRVIPVLVEGRVCHGNEQTKFRAVKHGTRKWRATTTHSWLPIKGSRSLWTTMMHIAAYIAGSEPGEYLRIYYISADELPIIPPYDSTKTQIGTRWFTEGLEQ